MALVMPLLLGIVAVLLQIGVLFIAYLSLVHATRDIGRFVAVHPDTFDGLSAGTGAPCTRATANGLWEHVCNNMPSVIDKNHIQDLPLITPACPSVDANGHCPRPTASAVTINMSFDSSSQIFLPTSVRWGPFLQFDVPASFRTMAYDYTVMVEPH
jgi:hypothetical protein